MKNLLTFYGSCGHITVEEVSEDEWEIAAEKNYSICCSDESTRMVYVYPFVFFLCIDCAEEDSFKEEFQALRYFFQSPLSFSHNYGIRELMAEREAQTIAFGKSMFPAFSEEKILRIAGKVL